MRTGPPAAVVAVVSLLGIALVGAAATVFGGRAPAPTAAATVAISAAMLTLHQSAATTCAGVALDRVGGDRDH